MQVRGMPPRRIVVGISGASGVIYGVRLLQLLGLQVGGVLQRVVGVRSQRLRDLIQAGLLLHGRLLPLELRPLQLCARELRSLELHAFQQLTAVVR